MNINFCKCLPKIDGISKAALALGVLLSLALAQPAPAKGQTSRPSGVLTFSNLTDFFDYNIKSREFTNHGKGENAYRAKNGYAIVKDSDDNLILVSPDGRTRRTVVAAKIATIDGFILSPEGDAVLYTQMSNFVQVHNIRTGDDKSYRCPVPVVPQDWMADGSLLAVLSYGHQKVVTDNGEIKPLNYVIIDKDFTHASEVSVDQPGTRPVDNISDLRIEASRRRIAFTWDAHVWIANIDGSGAKQITESEGFQVGEDRPAWSPDGKWLAIHHFDGLLTDIYLVPVDGRTHSMSDKGIIRLLDKDGLSSGVKGSGLTCAGRITWR